MPVAPGHPDYSAAGTNQFIPEIWSGKMQAKFYDFTCLNQITNTDWEGEIKKMGDSVIIRSLASINVTDYTVGQMLTYESPESPALVLSIDKGKTWGIKLNDVMKIQSDLPLLDKWTDDATQQVKIKVERGFFSDQAVYAGCHASNRGVTAGIESQSYVLGVSGAPLQVTKANVLEFIVDCGSVLDEQNVPEDERWFVIPTWMAGLIKKSDLKDASLTGDGKSILRNGRIGMIDRFTLYSSNLLYKVVDGALGTCYYSLFGHKRGLSFAGQITETEKIRHPFDFADVVRGLKVYGYKATKPEAYGVAYIKK
jgi:hypothetical protein